MNLISRKVNRSGLRISHSKVFSSAGISSCSHEPCRGIQLFLYTLLDIQLFSCTLQGYPVVLISDIQLFSYTLQGYPVVLRNPAGISSCSHIHYRDIQLFSYTLQGYPVVLTSCWDIQLLSNPAGIPSCSHIP